MFKFNSFRASLIIGSFAICSVPTWANTPINNLILQNTVPPSPPLQSSTINPNSPINPGVLQILNASTAVYSKMQSYQQTTEILERNAQNAIVSDHAYSLATERPNKFCYRSEDPSGVAAVCDGKTFVNFTGSDQTYTRTKAPASLDDIDIVNGVTFDPVGTYLIALMIQGRPLGDPSLRSGFALAPSPGHQVVNGVTYDTISAPVEEGAAPFVFYFNAQTHLLHKVVMPDPVAQSHLVEVIEDVKVNKPIPDSIFEYELPHGAVWII